MPTRELVVQIAAEVEKLTAYMSVRTLGVYGGVNINTQKKSVYQGIDVLVGTPGRVMDLALDNVIRFDSLQKLVIDEFDEMDILEEIEKGYDTDSEGIYDSDHE